MIRIVLISLVFAGTLSAHAQNGWLSVGGAEIREGIASFTSAEALKRKKKMGLGTALAGASGLAGLNLELNFAPDVTFGIGTGLGPDVRSFNLFLRQAFSSSGSLVPYFTMGYISWRGMESGPLERTSPPVLGRKFLTRSERESGKFQEHILYPALGLQYVNTDGDWSGLAFNFELLGLLDIDDFELGATGGIGATYYF